jgi:hypothetical protein
MSDRETDVILEKVSMAGRAKFSVGQVVRCELSYFMLMRRVYTSDRVASWDTGFWYYTNDDKGSQYPESALRPLTAREIGRRGSKRRKGGNG